MPGPLDKDLPVPLYHQLQCVLKAEIESGKWQPDEQIPTETKIAERFGVSKITVRQALQALAEQGYIRREQGRGTFVAQRNFDEGPRELTSFTEEMRRHDLVASSHVLEQSVVPADDSVADALRLPPHELVLILRRLRLADGEPMGVQTAHVPAALVPGLEKENLENVSLYETLQGRYGLYPARARETYFASLADRQAAELLQIPEGSPVYAAERVTLLPNEKPFEFVRSIMRGDRYSIVLDLVKDSAEHTALTLTD
jgi:GntR family transcriptional regulator